jgi:plastocyanin
VQLVGNDHAPVKPEVKRVVHFRTEAVQAFTVDMSDYKFVPAEITIEAGSSITFTNKDSDAKHNAVAVDGSFETPMLAQGESHTLTFQTPGEYEYYCTPHKSFMTGKIIVKP